MHPLTPFLERFRGSAIFLFLCLAQIPASALQASQSAATAAEPLDRETAPAAIEPAQSDPCRQIRLFNTISEHAAYLRACPAAPSRREHLAAIALLIAQHKGSYDEYRKFVMEFKDGMPFIPPVHSLALVGPEGLRVHDCLECLKNGMETSELLAKIRAQNGSYKDFSLEEIEMLKQMGLTSSIVQAMIESTLTAERETERQRRTGAAAGSAAGTQAVRDEPYGQQQQMEVPAAGAGSAPSVQDAVVNCAAQTAALEACNQLTGLARSICNATARTQFPCQ